LSYKTINVIAVQNVTIITAAIKRKLYDVQVNHFGRNIEFELFGPTYECNHVFYDTAPSAASSGMHISDYFLLMRLVSFGLDNSISHLCTSLLLWKLCVDFVVVSSEIRAC